jgi:hypothetical protein
MEPRGCNRWQRYDLPLAKEGVTFLAPQKEASPANPKAHMTEGDVNASARGRPKSSRITTRAQHESVRGTGHWHRIRRNLLFARARELSRG